MSNYLYEEENSESSSEGEWEVENGGWWGGGGANIICRHFFWYDRNGQPTILKGHFWRNFQGKFLIEKY